MSENKDIKKEILDLENRGVHLFLNNGKLTYKSPKGSLKEEDKDFLRKNKSTIEKIISNKNKYTPLSFSQQRFFFLDQLYQRSPLYNVPICTDLVGFLDTESLGKAINAVIQKHEIIRTTYTLIDGTPYQEVHPKLTIPIDVFDLSRMNTEDQKKTLLEKRNFHARQPFDITTLPLLRVYLYTLSENHHQLLISMHHIIADGWSLTLLGKEISHYYRKYKNGDNVIIKTNKYQYKDYVLYQKNWMKTKNAENQLNFWKKKLENITTLNLSKSKNHSLRDISGDMLSSEWGHHTRKKIHNLRNALKETEFCLSLSIFFILMHLETNETDITIGIPVSCRQKKEFESLLGTFMNTIPVRVHINTDISFEDHLLEVKRSLNESLSNQEYPFDLLVNNISDRSLQKYPFFNVLFLYEHFKEASFSSPDLLCSQVDISLGTSRFDLVFFMNSSDSNINISIEYPSSFKKEYILSLEKKYKTLIESISPKNRLNDIINKVKNKNFCGKYVAPISENEKKGQYTNWISRYKKVLFKEPTKIAISDSEGKYSFEIIWDKSKRLASFLKDSGAKPGDCIAFCMQASHQTVVVILSTFLVGCFYCPINPNESTKRKKKILSILSPSILITDKLNANKEISITNNIIYDETRFLGCPRFSEDVSAKEKDPAYIIFTSGTTGEPKGVLISHGSLMNLIDGLEHMIYKKHSIDNVAQNGSFSFDTSIKQWAQILNNRTLHILDDKTKYDYDNLINAIDNKKINCIDLTFTQCRILLDSGLSSYKPRHELIILVGGEDIPKPYWNIMRKHPKIIYYNLYGPTECCVDTTLCRINDSKNPNLGETLPNITIKILTETMKPAATGEIGEIFISGKSLALGYYKDRKLTNEKFISLEGEKSLSYRTGDLAIISDSGNIIYIGRSDRQIKRKGYRLELDEIEKHIEKNPFVKKSAVFVDEKKSLYAAILMKDYNIKDNRYLLPNGLHIFHLNRNETDFLYDDIFIKKAYLRNNIVIPDKSVVFDVGTNIGMFSLQANLTAKDVCLYSFEPNPYLQKIIENNFLAYKVNAFFHPCAIGKEESEMNLTFYPRMSFLSGLYANKDEEHDLIQSYLDKEKHHETKDISDESIRTLINTKLEEKNITVPVKTLSYFIDKYNIEKIDLLKINVEKGELAVIEGIRDNHWNKVQQIVVEIHDISGRLKKINDLLAEKGFNCVIDQDWSLTSNQNIHYIYGVKSNYSPGESSTNESIIEECAPMDLDRIKEERHKNIPHYMRPDVWICLDKFPQTNHGKCDYKGILSSIKNKPKKSTSSDYKRNPLVEEVKSIWHKILKKKINDIDLNFFDCGGHSLLLIQLRDQLNTISPYSFSLVDLFEFTTIKSQCEKISQNNSRKEQKKIEEKKPTERVSENDVAIIGMSGIFPKSKDIQTLWENLVNNEELLSRFEDKTNDENYIPVRGVAPGVNLFDAKFFSINDTEAKIMDPQQRVFLEQSWSALENSGINIESFSGDIGVFGSQSFSSYFINNVLPSLKNKNDPKAYQSLMLNDKDHLTLRTAYKLGLTGPAVTVQTACSSSLICVYLAYQSIISGDCDVAIAGGVSIVVPDNYGYIYTKQNIFSSDGHCKPFDNDADGTVGSNGAAVIVLKRLSDAIQNKDTIYALIQGAAINNDGNRKTGYTAPSITGQTKVIKKALKRANIEPEDICFIETHGTGTHLGDPIELKALSSVYGSKNRKNPLYIGSIKSNLGHLDAAAGVTSVIKSCISLKEGLLPATINYTTPNTEFNWENSNFSVNTKNKKIRGNTLYSAISALGIGGTNAHIILKNYNRRRNGNFQKSSLLILSAKTPESLENNKKNLLLYLKENKNICLCDVERTLQEGRISMKYKCYSIVKNKGGVTFSRTEKSNNNSNVSISICSNFNCINYHQFKKSISKEPIWWDIYSSLITDELEKILQTDADILSFVSEYIFYKSILVISDISEIHNLTGKNILHQCLTGASSFKDAIMNWNKQSNTPHPNKNDHHPEESVVISGSLFSHDKWLYAISQIWLRGAKFNWEQRNLSKHHYIIPLPTYSFNRKRHWINSKIPEIKLENSKESRSIEDCIKKIWVENLGLCEYDGKSRFFDIGGTSFIAISIIQSIQNETKIDMRNFNIYEIESGDKLIDMLLTSTTT